MKTPDEFRARLPEAEVVFGNLTGADLPAATNVKWVQTGNAGVESLDREFMASPIALTNMARIFAPAITETAIGMLLGLTRGITIHDMPQFARRQMKSVGTARSAHHVELAGKTMGIVGMGGIGSTLARRAHLGFDMEVVGTDAKPIPKPDHVAELRDPSRFMTMVPQVDVLVAAAPHTPATERMFNENSLPQHEEDRLLPGGLARHAVRRPGAGQGAERRLDCRCGTRRVPGGAAAVDAPDLRLHQRRDDAAHVGMEPRSADAADRSARRKPAALRDRRAAAQRGGQESGLLEKSRGILPAKAGSHKSARRSARDRRQNQLQQLPPAERHQTSRQRRPE